MGSITEPRVFARPRTNGFIERVDRTLLDECFRVAGRTIWYIDPEEIHRDLDVFLEYHNLKRSQQGYRLPSSTRGRVSEGQALPHDHRLLRCLCPSVYRKSVEIRAGSHSPPGVVHGIPVETVVPTREIGVDDGPHQTATSIKHVQGRVR